MTPKSRAMSEESEDTYEAKQKLVRDTCQQLYHKFVQAADASDPLQLAVSFIAKVGVAA